jgi:hypothetical protein
MTEHGNSAIKMPLDEHVGPHGETNCATSAACGYEMEVRVPLLDSICQSYAGERVLHICAFASAFSDSASGM